jgi:hypothetical protein
MGLKDFQIDADGGSLIVRCCRCLGDAAWVAEIAKGDDLHYHVALAVEHADEHHAGDTWQPHGMLRESAGECGKAGVSDESRAYGKQQPPAGWDGRKPAVAECPLCGGDYCPAQYMPGFCRHCTHDSVPAVNGGTLCAECAADDQICPECGYPLGS